MLWLGGATAWAQGAPAAAWNPQQLESAEPTWLATEVPAAVKPIAAESLTGLMRGLRPDDVSRLLGAPHSALTAGEAGEVWQYVVLKAGGAQAFIVSLWFDRRGLWRTSARSNPVGQLATMPVNAADAARLEPLVADPTAMAAQAEAPGAVPAAAAVPIAAASPAPAVVPPAPAATSPAPAASPAAPAGVSVESVPRAAAAGEQGAAADVARALRETVEAWADAWRKKDATAYVAHYAADYALPGENHAAWAVARHKRLKLPVFIHVTLEEVKVEDAQGAHPRVSFVQKYESDRYRETSRKTLTFVKQGGRWLIGKEENAKLAR
jgi:hypothetical protein